MLLSPLLVASVVPCMPPIFCPPRLCRLQGGDQARPVPPGPGEAVARQLLQVPNLRDHPHRRVHQQVSATVLAAGLGCAPWGWGCSEGVPSLAHPLLTPFSSLSQRDGVPYCESDYHAQFGIKCETCDRYISGRVLEVSPSARATPSRSGIGTACVLPQGACLGEGGRFIILHPCHAALGLSGPWLLLRWVHGHSLATFSGGWEWGRSYTTLQTFGEVAWVPELQRRSTR